MNAKNKNILILTYWSYKDALVQTYTLPYVRIIRKTIPKKCKLFLVTFDSKNYPVEKSEIIEIKNDLLKEGIIWLRFSYFPFGFTSVIFSLLSIFKLWTICISQKIGFIHAWCTPAGTLGYALSKTTGASLVIDSYEPHAESMVENGTWKKNGMAFKILFLLEKLQTKKADAVIAPVEGMRNYAKEKYGISFEKFFVKPACLDLEKFNGNIFLNQKRLPEFEEKIVCVYAGKFGGIYLKHEIFDFLKTAYNFWKGKFAVLLLTNAKRSEVEFLSKKAGLNPDIIFSKFIPHNEIPRYLSMADFAINPVKPVYTKRYCTSIKDGEYWAMGLPVVITKDISDDSKIIEDNKIGAVVESLDENGYLKAIHEIDFLLKNFSKEELYQKIHAVAEKYRDFSIAETVYKRIYSNPLQM